MIFNSDSYDALMAMEEARTGITAKIILIMADRMIIGT